MLLPGLLLLGGCSGLGHFFDDTEQLPGSNPNGTTGVSENLLRARGHEPPTLPITPQAGNVWPGPPQALPTLGDASHINPGEGDVLGGGATMPRGGSMSMGESNAVRGGAPVGDSFSGDSFSGAGLSQPIPDPASRFEHKTGGSAEGAGNASPGGAAGNGNIIIPNGDGTSTVISPDGSVKTIKGSPPK